MTAWDAYVAAHMPQVWLGIVMLSVAVMYLASKKLPSGHAWTALLAVLSVPVSIICGALASLVLVMMWSGSSTPPVNLPYLLETGLEYATPVFLVASLTMAIIRTRQSRKPAGTR